MKFAAILLLFILSSCSFVTDADWNSFDLDGDGYTVDATGQGEDCDDLDAAVHPEAAETCNEADDDCDGEVDEGVVATFYVDADGDGWGNPAFSVDACTAPEGYVADGTDCDDGEANTYPSAPELCDGEDNDCDGEADDDVQYLDWYRDSDGDGYGDLDDVLNDCAQPNGFVADATDCDDGDAAIHPEADEICDHIDNDCDDLTDFVDTDLVGDWTWHQDNDGDGHGDPATALDRCDQPAGYVLAGDDCDDARATVYPGADEVCGGLDDDCDGLVDEDDPDLTDAATWYADSDGDGYGLDTGTVAACERPTGYAPLGGDCDDGDIAYNPGAAETDCADPADYNCDGAIGYADADGDGWAACEECDDGDAAVYPGASELCNGHDDDCDGSTDEDDAADAPTWYADTDGDGYGDTASTTRACAAPSGFVAVATDCDDARAASHPGALEWCNGHDDDCDGTTDEDDAADASTWYADADGDGYGLDGTTAVACTAPSGYAAQGGDCNDGDIAYNPGAAEDDCTDPADYNCDGVTGYSDLDGDGWAACEECDDDDASVNPDATETCNGVDDDCDGTTDEGDASDALTWYADTDGDGYGDATTATRACSAPTGFVASASDCDDGRATSHPGATEFCNGYDDDCDGTADEDDAADAPTWYADVDGDGYGEPTTTTRACAVPTGFSAAFTDCDDSDAGAFPGATELCDGVDDDCDGTVDEDDAADASTWYADSDGDGYGDAGSTHAACLAPSGFVADDADCDDGDATINPAATELCDGLDDDCDGTVDEDDAADALIWYADLDGDGYGDIGDAASACAQPLGFVADNRDCDDIDGDVHPGATELCDGYDDDCDGITDEDNASDAPTWYADADGDGYGDPASTSQACSAPSGFLADDTDCEDLDPAVHPGAEEHCDGLDEDCDGSVDEDAVDKLTLFVDGDGDGYGDASSEEDACSASSGLVADATDCDDGDISVNPGVLELCGNGVDDDCDGTYDGCGLSGSMTIADASVVLDGSSISSTFGSTFEAVPDVDGDGVVDLLVGAYNAPTDANTVHNGQAYVYLGPIDSSTSVTAPDATLIQTVGGNHYMFGEKLAVGDFDGDGLSDIAVAGGGDGEAYEASILSGTVSTSAATASFYWGIDCMDAADGDDDGFDDLLFGRGYWAGEPWGVILLRGPLSGSYDIDAVGIVLAPSDTSTNSGLGESVAWVGDFDGDGISEFLAGASYDGTAGSNAGAAFLVSGDVAVSANIEDVATTVLLGEVAGSTAGQSISQTGDTDNDGYMDVLVGAPADDQVASNAGAAYLVRGGSAVPLLLSLGDADASFRGDTANQYLGYYLTGGCDLNGDGKADLTLSSWGSPDSTLVFEGPVSGAQDIGNPVARISDVWVSRCLGDMNNDGYDDLGLGGGIFYLFAGGGM